jgi:hypothetical protein
MRFERPCASFVANMTVALKKGTVSGHSVHRSVSLLLNLEIPVADLLLP